MMKSFLHLKSSIWWLTPSAPDQAVERIATSTRTLTSASAHSGPINSTGRNLSALQLAAAHSKPESHSQKDSFLI